MRFRWTLVAMALLTLAHVTTSFAKEKIDGWGKTVDPDGDCKFIATEDGLEIVAGSTHGLSIELGRMNAPRVLGKINGDFVLEVKVEGDFSPGSKTVPQRTPYNGAGLLVMGDDKNYVTLVRAVLTRDGENIHYANFEVRQNGTLQGYGLPNDCPLEPTKPTWLRLERRSNAIHASVRQDEGSWFNLTPKTAELPSKTQAGVVAINASSKAFSTRFSDLRRYTASSIK